MAESHTETEAETEVGSTFCRVSITDSLDSVDFKDWEKSPNEHQQDKTNGVKPLDISKIPSYEELQKVPHKSNSYDQPRQADILGAHTSELDSSAKANEWNKIYFRNELEELELPHKQKRNSNEASSLRSEDRDSEDSSGGWVNAMGRKSVELPRDGEDVVDLDVGGGLLTSTLCDSTTTSPPSTTICNPIRANPTRSAFKSRI